MPKVAQISKLPDFHRAKGEFINIPGSKGCHFHANPGGVISVALNTVNGVRAHNHHDYYVVKVEGGQFSVKQSADQRQLWFNFFGSKIAKKLNDWLAE